MSMYGETITDGLGVEMASGNACMAYCVTSANIVTLG